MCATRKTLTYLTVFDAFLFALKKSLIFSCAIKLLYHIIIISFVVIHKKLYFRSGYRWNVNHCASSALPIRCLFFNSTVLSMIARATEFCICLHASVKAVGVKLRGTLKKSLCFCSNASKPRCVFTSFQLVCVARSRKTQTRVSCKRSF